MNPLVDEISTLKTLAVSMLKGDLPISHHCWAVVSQGFSSYAVLLKYLEVIFLLRLSLLVGLSSYVDGQTPGVLRAGWHFLWWEQTALEFIVISVSWESGNVFRKPSLVWGDSWAMYLQSFFFFSLKLAFSWTSEVSRAVPCFLLWVGEFWTTVSPLWFLPGWCFVFYCLWSVWKSQFHLTRTVAGGACMHSAPLSIWSCPVGSQPLVKVPQIMQSLSFKFLFFQPLFLVSSHSTSFSFPSLSGGEKKASKATTANFKTWNKRGKFRATYWIKQANCSWKCGFAWCLGPIH